MYCLYRVAVLGAQVFLAVQNIHHSGPLPPHLQENNAPHLASTVASVAVGAQQERYMIRLPLLHTEGNRNLWEKSVLLTKVSSSIKAQRPA
jgi:hypothetical protein